MISRSLTAPYRYLARSRATRSALTYDHRQAHALRALLCALQDPRAVDRPSFLALLPEYGAHHGASLTFRDWSALLDFIAPQISLRFRSPA